MKPLFPYQERAVEAARAARRGGSRAILVVAPTGSGKTRLGVEVAMSAVSRGGSVLWLTHREELCDQAVEALKAEGVETVGVIRSTDKRADASAPVQVASIPTLVSRDFRPPATVVVVDECHHIKSNSWMSVAGSYRSSVLIGLTATPQRADGSPLGDVFDSLVNVASYSELIALGRLVPCDVISPTTRLSNGISMLPWDAYMKYCRGRQAIVFAGSVEIALACRDTLQGQGVVSGAIHGSTPTDERKALIEAFRARRLDVLTSCLVLTEGFDAPNVACCIMARRADHVGTYIQMAGRILRACPGKTRALLVDLTGAIHQHGMPTKDREYDLGGEGIKRHDRSIKPWQCPNCGCFSATFYEICPMCGHTLDENEKSAIRKIMVSKHEHKLYLAEQEQKEIARRSDNNLCSIKQAKLLRKYKLRDDVTSEEASMLIGAIAKCGWVRVPVELRRKYSRDLNSSK